MTVFVTQLFEVADGTLLQAIDPKWEKLSAAFDNAVVGTGRIYWADSGNPASYLYNEPPGTADYEVSSNIYIASTSITSNAGPIARAIRGISTKTCYWVRYRRNTGVQLFKYINDAATQLGSTVTGNYDVGVTLKLTVRCEGSAISALVNDVVVIGPITDTSIPGAGFPGLITASLTNSGPLLDDIVANTLGAADVTAPVLTTPTGTPTGTTTASGTVTTDEANGTLYAVVTASATPPSAADIRAGTGAVYATSQAVSATGVQNVAATGLTAETTYYWHFLHDDAAANPSNIASSASFTTDAIVASGVTVTEPLKNNTGTLLASQTGITVAILQASDLVSVNEQTGLSTNASGLLPLIESVSIIAGTSYYVAIKLADGSVGITGPIVAS